MKIIVTGGAGFIGSHVVDTYIRAGHRVSIIDNLSTGSRRNINPRAKFYKADIRDPQSIEKILKNVKPDVVNHHAALASVIASIKNPNATFEVNVLGTVNLLRAFGTIKNAEKFIFISTGGAMYTTTKLPASEKIPPSPLSPYGLSKLLGEETVKFYAHTLGFNFSIFRYANVYGPRQNPHGEAGVVAIFKEQMKRGERPTIFGDGTKARDYVYVEDLAKASVAALTKGNGGLFNFGLGKLVTDKQVFDTVAEAVGFRKTPRFAPVRPGEVQKISLDAGLARRVLGWKPTTSFEEGVRQVASSK
ncbi:MAG: SDR family NAD(P)-dependent oxidoreductase [Candidatus Liptonbacteria bacterium]|nr:SDR family NAD(P)-dependent oxidoreductase [Candidatus Liptonbacteria bacterium]